MLPTTGSHRAETLQYEKEVERANDERLASARALQEQDASIRELRQQNAELMAKHTSLQSEVLMLTKQVMAVKLEPTLTMNSHEWQGTSTHAA